MYLIPILFNIIYNYLIICSLSTFRQSLRNCKHSTTLFVCAALLSTRAQTATATTAAAAAEAATARRASAAA